MIGLIKWGAFIVALLCLIGFIALYFACQEDPDKENAGLNPLDWIGGFFENIGCEAGKTTTKWVGIGSFAVFVILFGIGKLMSPPSVNYDDEYDDY